MPRKNLRVGPPEISQISPNDPHRSCRISISGPDVDTIMDAAIARAAGALNEPRQNLYVAHSTTATPDIRERFVPHLGVEPRILTWSMSCTVRISPEVIDQRRELGRERHLEAVPDVEEDPEEVTGDDEF